MLFDLLFVLMDNKIFAFLACFFIGLAMNSIRIVIREKLSLLANNQEQAFLIGQSSAVFYVLFQSIASLVIGFILANVVNVNITQVFLPLIASIITMLVFYYQYLLSKN